MNKKIKVVVTGGTGTVGSQVVSELLKRNAQVSVLTRRPDAKLPPGVQAICGDLGDVQTIRTAFKGFDGLFLLSMVGPGEANEGILGVDGARLGGVKRLVYLSVHKADEAPHLPHFGCKLGVEAAVKASGAQWTILRPNNFYQNDFWFKDVIKQGIYPQPLGDVGSSRVDVRDIAEAAAIALVDGCHSGLPEGRRKERSPVGKVEWRGVGSDSKRKQSRCQAKNKNNSDEFIMEAV